LNREDERQINVSEHKRKAAQREQNKQEWVAHYKKLAQAHTKLAVGHVRKALELEEGE
jgi:hypothetical protein